jgi:hypothetical protein
MRRARVGLQHQLKSLNLEPKWIRIYPNVVSSSPPAPPCEGGPPGCGGSSISFTFYLVYLAT